MSDNQEQTEDTKNDDLYMRLAEILGPEKADIFWKLISQAPPGKYVVQSGQLFIAPKEEASNFEWREGKKFIIPNYKQEGLRSNLSQLNGDIAWRAPWRKAR